MNLIFIVVVIAAFYLLLILPQNRRRKQTAAMQQTIEPGTRIVTTSGMFGTVVDLEDDALVVEIADEVEIRLMRAAVMRVVPDTTDEFDDAEDADGDDAEDADGDADGDDAEDADEHASDGRSDVADSGESAAVRHGDTDSEGTPEPSLGWVGQDATSDNSGTPDTADGPAADKTRKGAWRSVRSR